KKYKTLILDLRRNGGGLVETLQRLVGNLFDRDITIGNMKLRKESKPMLAKTRGDSGYKGQVFVLVDSESGSASEVLARVVQLEKRGTVLGDRTYGKVMRSRVPASDRSRNRNLLRSKRDRCGHHHGRREESRRHRRFT
ncbi:MAG TPA: S41 family peptidase, partial [Pyrinomonadaceae bacterium]|nr:S41 family peptidase [Pyrinomonadaceae bacterium]